MSVAQGLCSAVLPTVHGCHYAFQKFQFFVSPCIWIHSALNISVPTPTTPWSTSMICLGIAQEMFSGWYKNKYKILYRLISCKKTKQTTFKWQLISNEIILKWDFSTYCSEINSQETKNKTQTMRDFGYPSLMRSDRRFSDYYAANGGYFFPEVSGQPSGLILHVQGTPTSTRTGTSSTPMLVQPTDITRYVQNTSIYKNYGMFWNILFNILLKLCNVMKFYSHILYFNRISYALTTIYTSTFKNLLILARNIPTAVC
jgi:hypothetical protein